MRKILLTIAILLSFCCYAQAPLEVDRKIKEAYGEDYTLVSVDTVQMPIRIVMSMDFALTLDSRRAIDRLNLALELKDPTNQMIAIRKLASDMESNLKDLVKIEDIEAMRNSNERHEDDYYNYQRTTVYLKESEREEIFYIRLGEESISMTHLDYLRLEAQAFLKYRQYRDLMRKLKEASK